ncbi:MAG TPA: M20/M25/M40 family metallo-hydrolase [Acidobacteriota bacterium]|nr:M20/M25/M40 family metallo-hydrolase [Acidobacteriota bacterium]
MTQRNVLKNQASGSETRNPEPGTRNPVSPILRRLTVFLALFVCLTTTLPSGVAHVLASNGDEVEKAMKSIRAETLRAHVRFLADDLLEGRGPGTRGAELAARYIASQFETYGLEPAVNGGYYQNVPIVNIKAEAPTAKMEAAAGGKKEVLTYGEEFTVQSGLGETDVDIHRAEVVFVGYGITAPEMNWDDYKNVDVKGKIVMSLVNDPPSEDPKFFGGPAMTYYGRWVYKYEEAARHGALGVVLVHTTESASYPWQVVQSSNTGNRSELARDASSPPVVKVKSWVNYDSAFRFAKLGGHNLQELEKQAQKREFQAVPLGIHLNVSFKSQVTQLNSPNVAGLLRGSDPELSKQFIVFTAHYDHLGLRERNPGDKIYNGALDNASGVAGLLAVAEAMSQMTTKPKRSILFLSVTAEEQGLLGAQYYAEHPIYPLLQTAANVNLDGLNIWGETRDFTPMGSERSTLGKTIDGLAAKLNLKMRPDPFPEKGFFFRSDHFCFAKVGVPCVSVNNGIDVVGKPDGWGKEREQEYTAKDYHQPSDEITPEWDFNGCRQHAQFAFLITATVANDPKMPEWNDGESFKNARDAMRKK